MRKATGRKNPRFHHTKISIPAFREEGDAGEIRVPQAHDISIPAFREEGDRPRRRRRSPRSNFNPRLP